MKINFEIRNAERSPYTGIYIFPYELRIVDEHLLPQTAVKQRCALNGHLMEIDDRIVVRGGISDQLPISLHKEWAEDMEKKQHTWACCFHWDGLLLTAFREKAYIENCQNIIQL